MEHPGIEAHSLSAPKPPKEDQAQNKTSSEAARWIQAYALRKGGLRTAWLTEVIEVHDDETLDLPGAPQIIGLPGHSEGSIAVYVPLADAVFVGDGLTTRHVLTGKKGPQPAPFTDEPDRAITSLRAIVDTGASWVLPGHGPPWNSGVEAAVLAVETAAGTAK